MAGESGAESVEKYHGRAADLIGLIHISAEAFLNTVNCSKKFHYKDDLAWDQDFEAPGVGTPSTGTDHSYVDNVDIVFFAGHGTPNGPYFGRSDRDDGQAKPDEVRWGDKDLRWIAFHACQTLHHSASNNVCNRWRKAFQGLHYILGFSTIAWTCGDTLGKRFAQLLNTGVKVRDAWIRACKESQPSSTHTAYLRADIYEGDKKTTDTYNDHLWGHGYVSPDPHPSKGTLKLFYYSAPC